jgi:hypothetical protein
MDAGCGHRAASCGERIGDGLLVQATCDVLEITLSKFHDEARCIHAFHVQFSRKKVWVLYRGNRAGAVRD